MKTIPDLSGVRDPAAFVDELARRDFVSFLIRAFPWINGGANLLPNWHIDAIAHRLERVRSGDCRRLIVCVPPRSLKSVTVSVAWVAWCLGRDPSLNFVCVSYSGELASKHARDTRAIMTSPWYLRLFPRTALSPMRLANHDFETTLGGGRLATSIGGTLTGRGGDIIIVDDPIKPDEAMSETTRNSVNEWFHTTLASRLNDKKRGAILLVMQRLHQNDLAGMLLESGEWDELSLPAIAIEDESIPLTRGRTHHRRRGEALHAAREPREELLRIKESIGSIIFAAQYQQQPVPAEGNFVKPEWFGYYDEPPTGGTVVQSWDTASKTGIYSDFSVGITARHYQRRYYILDVFRERVDFVRLRAKIVQLCQRYRVNRLLIEDAASGTQLIQILRQHPPQGVPRPVACKPENDKISRFAVQTSRIEAGEVLLPRGAPWLADFLSEIVGFPNARHDDQADALGQLLRHPPFEQPLGLAGPRVSFPT